LRPQPPRTPSFPGATPGGYEGIPSDRGQLSQRPLAAPALGVACGATGFLVSMGAGVLLYQRIWGDSPLALIVVLALFGGAGAYGGFLLGILAFSALREDDGGTPGRGDGPA